MYLNWWKIPKYVRTMYSNILSLHLLLQVFVSDRFRFADKVLPILMYDKDQFLMHKYNGSF